METLDSYIDWTDCELVERVPGKVSGRPIVRGTRILADTIVQDAELGSPLEDIHELPQSAARRHPAAYRLRPFAPHPAGAVKVLFDHNLPHKLRTELGARRQHEIVTASIWDGGS
jgi:hypothetical protein